MVKSFKFSPSFSLSGVDAGVGGGMGDISPPIFDMGDGLCNHPLQCCE